MQIRRDLPSGRRREVMESFALRSDPPVFSGQEKLRGEKCTFPYRKPTLVDR